MMIDMSGKCRSLRELMEEKPVFAPCVYDCFTARIVEKVGFEAMCLSGGSLAMAYCGVPDIGLVPLADLEAVVSRITTYAGIPMIVDIDTGFGNELNVMYTCERILRAGAKAVHLEDQTFPKRCGHLGGKEVIPRAEYISKIRAAHSVLEGTDCMLIARTDSYHIPGMGVEEAIRRNLEAREAGADITFTEGTGSYEDIERVAKADDGWKMFDMVCNGASPRVTFPQLVDYGYRLVTVPGVSVGGAYKGVMEAARRTLEDGSDFYIAQEGSNPLELAELFHISGWLGAAKQFNEKIQQATGLKSRD